MIQGKYVVIKYPERLGGETIYIFPKRVNHARVARLIAPIRDIVSAGFIQINNEGKPICYGTSESLKLSAREKEDTELALAMK